MLINDMGTFGFKVTSCGLWIDIQYALIHAPGCWIRHIRKECGGGGIKRCDPHSACVKLQVKQRHCL